MNPEFGQVPEDADTEVLFRKEDKIRDYDVLFEFWVSEGISTVSAIFLKADIGELSDEALIKMIQEKCHTGTVTISRTNEKYVFVNYSFKTIAS